MRALALLALLAVACTPAPPTGVELDAGPALDIILATYHSQAAHPRVIAVEWNCSDVHDGGTGFGFWFEGACRGGYVERSTGIVYIVIKPGNNNRYSDHLAHEVRHWVDFAPDHTSPGFFPDVARAQVALKASPYDLMPVGVGGLDQAR